MIMQKIRMVDLHGQYLHVKGEIDQAIQRVIDNTAFINGEDVRLFADELATYLNVPHVIPCANGTDALQIALMALDLNPGDEVIVPAFTYTATAEVILLLGYTPVYVDVYPDTFNIDPEKIKEAITPRTRVIMPVHLFGQCADMESILKIAGEHNLYVIEDNAQSIGADYTFSDGRKVKSGCMGHFGTTSFFPSKNLGCFGDGGAIITNDEKLAVKAKMISNHGQEKQYHHKLIGVNSRLDTLQAAILRVKLQHLDEYIAARQNLAAYYDEHLSADGRFSIPARSKNSTHVFHQYTLQLKEGSRDELIQQMKNQEIPVMIYYPMPVNEQEAYFTDRIIPVSHHLCETVFSLPMHTEMSQEQREYIVGNLLASSQKPGSLT
ncbi:MAG: aminotransferase class I/II-fold pyridoxal phosphate-dependent enzyme [Bacteroidetes bacterium]|nr:aminotransferase class I/II-fold pyridoxal phosphate-dependent enzyme [Bacteroidota bacterium]